MPDRMPAAVSTDSVLDATQLRHLVSLVRADALDAAIDAGLLADWPAVVLATLTAEDRGALTTARARLRSAWAARERYRARTDRLARRAAERDAKRAPPPAPTQKPVLPTGAAAILARAKARAAGNHA